MTQGILNINLCMTFKLPIMKNKLLLISSLLTVTGNNNTMYGKMGLVTEMFIPNCQSLFFKLTQSN